MKKKGKKYDISIHFVPGTDVSKVERKLAEYLKQSEVVNFKDREEHEPRTVLHHCFFPEWVCNKLGQKPDIARLMRKTGGEYCIEWYFSNCEPYEALKLMLANLKRLGGASIFIGDPEHPEIKHEFELVREHGIHYILIPL